MRIIMVRHGRTAWNTAEKFRGRADLPLDDFGLRQSRAAADTLAGSGAAAVLASPLQRTLMTAQAIADSLSLRVRSHDGLIDIDYGSWQGLSTREAAQRDSRMYQNWLRSPHEVRFPGGEGLTDVRRRIEAVIAEMISGYPDQTVILVSHVVVCRIFICTVLGLDSGHFWQIGQDVCAINSVSTRDGVLVLNSLNDTCHLRSLTEQ